MSIGVVVLWFLYMFYALRQVRNLGDELFAPLGLRLASLPSVHVSLFHDIRSMQGTVSYTGHRRGRDIAVVIGGNGMGILVAGPAQTARPPRTANQMAALTGLQPSCWRNVTVTIGDSGIVVGRKGRGSGKWFLHDILLAESVAGHLPGSHGAAEPESGPGSAMA